MRHKLWLIAAGAMLLAAWPMRAEVLVVIDGDVYLGHVDGHIFKPCKGDGFDLNDYPTIKPVDTLRRCPRGGTVDSVGGDAEADAAEARAAEAETKALQASLKRLRAKQRDDDNPEGFGR
jgi:hypothetical protein